MSQIISRSLTLTQNKSESLETLLTDAGVILPESRRVAGIKLQATGHNIYLVDREMATYPMTANVPNSYGYKIPSSDGHSFEESQHPANQLSLADIIVVSGGADAKLHVWAYNV